MPPGDGSRPDRMSSLKALSAQPDCNGLRGAALDLAANCVQNALASKLTQLDSFVASLESLNILPHKTAGGSRGHKKYRRKEFSAIRDHCIRNGFREWGNRPRTLTVLMMLGQPAALDGFVAQNLSDLALPYTAENLPKVITGASRAKFLQCQDYVIDDSANLEKPGRSHQAIHGSADDFFIVKRILGKGGFGVVDHVMGPNSLQDFARKRIPRGRSFKSDMTNIRNFEVELQNFKGLSHRHLVKLIGSYTDRTYVGLLMQPVADMDLKTYLSSPSIDDTTRSNALRGFYGCMASAVEYLHEKMLRHNDIKPSNVLVKDHQVYLTDLNSSRRWANENSESSGTTSFFHTEGYCAPEVKLHGSRKASVDIWSLGCVFLEMRSALSGKSVAEQRQFFKSHGTGGIYVRTNKDAALMWLDELSNKTKIATDNQLHDLILHMCREEADERPTAVEVVSDIHDMASPYNNPYLNPCCDRNESKHALDRTGDTTDLSRGYTTTSADSDCTTTLLVHTGAETVDLPCTHQTGQDEKKTLDYKSPSIQDVDDDVTIRHLFPSEEELLSPTTGGEAVCQDLNVSRDDDKHATDIHSTALSSELSVDSDTVLCSAKGRPPTELTESTAQVTPSPGSDDYCRSTQTISSKRSTPIACLWPGCTETFETQHDSVSAIRSHLRSQHHTHELGLTSLLGHQRRTARSAISDTGSLTSEYQYTLRRRIIDKRVRFATEEEVLPDAATADTAASYEEFISTIKSSDGISPLHCDYLHQLAETTERSSANVLPTSSLVPSFYKACTNLLSEHQIYSLLTRDFSRASPVPLFVCGSLMFPSILQSQALRFIGGQGTYSAKQQRRIWTGKTDWAMASSSAQHAVDIMTPAVIHGASLCRVADLDCPVLSVKTPQGDPVVSGDSGLVAGFLVFGLSEGALHCLDKMFTTDGGQYLNSTTNETWPDGLLCGRRSVQAHMQTAAGTIMQVTAQAYIGAFDDVRTSRWEIQKFATSRTFQYLSEDSERLDEQSEENFAAKLGITHVMAKSPLRNACVRGDYDEVWRLLHYGHNAQETCPGFGTHLQAAAYGGSARVVELLLAEGAKEDLNKEGGEYQTALIAATVQGHTQVVDALLVQGANVLAPGSTFISALYQAVDFGRTKIARKLLEKGAWLTSDYQELLDLAMERNDTDMLHLLYDYDVRMLHRRTSQGYSAQSVGSATDSSRIRDVSDDDSDSSLGSRHMNTSSRPFSRRDMTASSNEQISKRNVGIFKAVTLQIVFLKGTRGKWTGIKGVKAMKAAIAAGMPESIIDRARPHLPMANDLLTLLNRAVADMSKDDWDELRTGATGAAIGSASRSRRRAISPGRDQSRVAELPDDPRPRRAHRYSAPEPSSLRSCNQQRPGSYASGASNRRASYPRREGAHADNLPMGQAMPSVPEQPIQDDSDDPPPPYSPDEPSRWDANGYRIR